MDSGGNSVGENLENGGVLDDTEYLPLALEKEKDDLENDEAEFVNKKEDLKNDRESSSTSEGEFPDKNEDVRNDREYCACEQKNGEISMIVSCPEGDHEVRFEIVCGKLLNKLK